jgi:hypothetical protein
MKKQYTVHEGLFYRTTIRIYLDGKLVETFYKWKDEAEEFIKNLEVMGYTLAFTKEEIDKTKEQYEYMIDKVLVEEKTPPKIQLRSDSSVPWETEEEYPLHTGRHSQ